MCLSINRSKAYGVKDDIIQILEDNKCFRLGETSNSFASEIKETMKNISYRTQGKCSEGYIGYDREGNVLQNEKSSAAFCIKKIDVGSKSAQLPDEYYYKVEVFYQLDLPIFNSIFNFKINGDTAIIYPKTCK